MISYEFKRKRKRRTIVLYCSVTRYGPRTKLPAQGMYWERERKILVLSPRISSSRWARVITDEIDAGGLGSNGFARIFRVNYWPYRWATLTGRTWTRGPAGSFNSPIITFQRFRGREKRLALVSGSSGQLSKRGRVREPFCGTNAASRRHCRHCCRRLVHTESQSRAARVETNN